MLGSHRLDLAGQARGFLAGGAGILAQLIALGLDPLEVDDLTLGLVGQTLPLHRLLRGQGIGRGPDGGHLIAGMVKLGAQPGQVLRLALALGRGLGDRKSTRLNSSHSS